MADLAWHVSLLRLLMFGFSSLYQDLPHTVAYTERILAHSTLKQVSTVFMAQHHTDQLPGYLHLARLSSLPPPHLPAGKPGLAAGQPQERPAGGGGQLCRGRAGARYQPAPGLPHLPACRTRHPGRPGLLVSYGAVLR